MKDVLREAIDTYGADMQLNVAVEEFSELTKEICKYKRGEDNIDRITEEMADCYIMLQQMEMIFNISTVSITKEIMRKRKRLENRIEKYKRKAI